MLTLAIVSIMFEYANQARDLTGGDDGLQGITIAPIFGLFEFNIFGQTAYVYALVVLFVWFLISWRIVHSPFGRSLDGIRQNARRMRAIGTPVWWRLLAVYTLSAAMAGSAGALSAHATRFVGLIGAEPAHLRHRHRHARSSAARGGSTARSSAPRSTTWCRTSTAKISPYFWEFIVGGMLMATVLFLEGGLMDLGRVGRNLIARFRQRTGGP